MKKTKYLIVYLILFFATTQLWAQALSGEAISLKEIVVLRSAPAIQAGSAGAEIHQWEKVKLLGETGKSVGPDGKEREFWEVETKEGKRGWISAEYLAKDGTPAVFLQKEVIYGKPGMYSTNTQAVFQPGDLVARMESIGDWVECVSANGKRGWVKGLRSFSTESVDIKMGEMVNKALAIPNKSAKVKELKQLQYKAEYGQSQLSWMVTDALNELNGYMIVDNSNAQPKDEDLWASHTGSTTPRGESGPSANTVPQRPKPVTTSQASNPPVVDPPQPITIDEQLTGRSAICLWKAVSLRESPGRSTKRTGAIVYNWETFVLTGKTGEAIDDDQRKRTYWEVKTIDNKVGWIHSYLCALDGQVGGVTTRGQIYKRPNAFATITEQFFEAGEIVVMSEPVGNWVYLVGFERKKIGWVEGVNKITKDHSVIKDMVLHPDKYATVSMPNTTPPYTPPTKPQTAPQTAPQQTQPHTQPHTTKPEQPFPANPASSGIKDEVVDINFPVNSINSSTAPYIDKVIDVNTQKPYWRVMEIGNAYEIRSTQPSNIFIAYHKSLPIGTKIFLDIPDNSGFVQVNVVGQLREDNANVIGLTKDCLYAIFGDSNPKEVKIQYFIAAND